MSATLPDTFPFRSPPRAEDPPWSDGEPMESDRHVKQMALLVESLRMEWIDRKDVFVVLDAEEKERRLSWVVWHEGARTPRRGRATCRRRRRRCPPGEAAEGGFERFRGSSGDELVVVGMRSNPYP